MARFTVQQLMMMFGDLRRRPRREQYSPEQVSARQEFRAHLEPAITAVCATGRWEVERESSYVEWYLRPISESALARSLYVTPADWQLAVAFEPATGARGRLRGALRASGFHVVEDAKWDAVHDMRVQEPLAALLASRAAEWEQAIRTLLVPLARAAKGPAERAG